MVIRLVDGVVLILFGCILIAAPIAAYVNLRRVHETDVTGIARLREVLDSTRVAAGQAATSGDSTQLAQEIDSRVEGLARREYHVPLRAASLRGWWRLGGVASWCVAAGLCLVAVGAGVVYRRRPASG